MIFNAIKSDKFDIDYLELPKDKINSYDYSGYGFYVFNWHHNTLPVSKATLQNIKGLKIGIVLEVGPVEMKPFMVEDLFDAYMIIDPTKDRSGKFFPFPRPLERVDNLLPLLSDIPVFGTFGFMVPGKNFGEILKQANNLKRDCIVRMNITASAFTGGAFSLPAVVNYCNTLYKFKADNVDLRITNDYMSKQDLIRWCSQNSLNIFPYYRDLPGLSATTDQAISAGRGIAITNCNTFRHMAKYINYFPKESYMELSVSTLPGVQQMKSDWSADKFTNAFLDMMGKLI